MELRRYAEIVWRWLWLVALASLLAGLTAFLVSRQLPPIYEASTTLIVNPAQQSEDSNYNAILTGERLSRTYAEWLRKRPVMEGVVATLGLEIAPDELADQVSVQHLRETQLLVLLVRDTNPHRAAAIANSIPEVFGWQSQELQARRFADSKAALTEQLGLLSDEITRTQARISELESARSADSTEIDRQQAGLRVLQSNYTTLFQSLGDIRLVEARNTDSVFTIEPALPPTSPIFPRPLRNAALAAIVGAVLAAAAAFLVEYLDDVLKNPDDVKEALGVATLGAVPSGTIPADSSELIMLQPGQSQAIEAFRVLRTNLQFASVGRPLHSLVITSPAPSEGKSWTAANLAVVLAQAGQRVTLIDADLHRPRQHRVFKLPNNVGLTTALLAAATDQNLPLQDGPLPGLRVLTSGPLPPNAAELLGSTRMVALMSALGEISDIVIIDSPPVTALADTAILASQSDGVLLILDATKTRRELAERAMEGLRRVQAHVVGAVLNRMPARGGGYYYYYYHYTHYEDSDNGRNGHDKREGGLRRRLSQPFVQSAKQRKG